MREGEIAASFRRLEAAIGHLESLARQEVELAQQRLVTAQARLAALSERKGRAIRLWDIKDELGSTVRVRLLNACANAGLETLGDIADRGQHGIRRANHLGPASISSLAMLLRRHGVSWAIEYQDAWGRWRMLK